MSTQSIKEVVKEKYGRGRAAGSHWRQFLLRRLGGASTAAAIRSPRDLYDAAQALQIPEEALKASLGCGNPTALAQLNAGETVLDLGSGGGIDVLLSAKRVGPTGKAYGLDMTDEMLALARENQRKSGVENVEFLKGEIENIPLPDNSVDVIISNCVINLSADKDRVLREAFRVSEARRTVCGIRRCGTWRRAAGSARERVAMGRLHRRSAAGYGVRRQAGGCRL